MTISGVTVEPVEHDGAERAAAGGGALPRRSAQEHLEPQLREERGAGHGTPFAPFTPTEDAGAEEPAGAEPDGDGRTVPGAAGFREGADRGRRGRHAVEGDDD